MISFSESYTLRASAFPRLALSCVVLISAIFLSIGARAASLQRTASEVKILPREQPTVLIIGFVGGFVRHDNLVHAEVQLAARLRSEYPSGVDVETFESHHVDRAYRAVLKFLDADHDGKLTKEEKQNARIVLYGHSWGASASIALANKLERDAIPVALTVQVDSVAMVRQSGRVIPANVAKAANFYQPNGIVRGEPAIRAADPNRTHIIGNFRFEYRSTPYACDEYPWYDRLFAKPHTQIECDPKVWEQVASLIHATLADFNVPYVKPPANSKPDSKTGSKTGSNTDPAAESAAKPESVSGK